MIVHEDKGIGGVRDHRFKDFSRVSERLIDGALTNCADLNEMLFGIEKNNAEQFAIEKAHLGTEVGDRQRTIDCERLTFLPERNGTHAKGTNKSQGFRPWNEGQKLLNGGASQDGEGTEMLQEGVSLFLRTNDQPQVLGGIQRFRTIVN
jgi:hypothetical protein